MFLTEEVQGESRSIIYVLCADVIFDFVRPLYIEAYIPSDSVPLSCRSTNYDILAGFSEYGTNMQICIAFTYLMLKVLLRIPE